MTPFMHDDTCPVCRVGRRRRRRRMIERWWPSLAVVAFVVTLAVLEGWLGGPIR